MLLVTLVTLGVGLVVTFVLFATRVAALRAFRATGPNWTFPSRIYSDGVILVPGRVLPSEHLLAQLEARGYRAVRGSAIAAGTYARTFEGFEIVLRGFPHDADPLGSGGPERVRLRIAGGYLTAVERLGGLQQHSAPDTSKAPRLEPILVALLFDEDRIWRTWVALERIPEPVRDAIVAAEDRRFHSHLGVDLRGYLRALVSNVRSGEVREGGSTITQQLTRNLFLGRGRTIGRKLAEVPLALGLQLLLGRRQILEMYLNSVYWGQAKGYGVSGVAEAARWYFDAPVESLGVLEAATLAAMIPAPNAFNPFERPRVVRKRRNQVLRDMVEARRLTPEVAEALARQPLRVRRGPPPTERFPSFTGFVRDQLSHDLDREAASRYGLAIFTTMDLVWQQQAEAELASTVASLDAGGRRPPRLEGAFVALEPLTGAVRAMVAGRSPRAGEFNRAYQARRQTGSAIKPIVYAAALANGHGSTPATLVPDTPRAFHTDRGLWSPRNDDGTYHTQVTLAKALERSLNVATTNLVDRIGPRRVAQVAERFGLGRLKPVMSIGLGSNEATLIDLTSAFAVFGDRGMLHRPSPIRAVVDRSGRALLVPPDGRPGDGSAKASASPGRGVRAIPEPVAALMTGLLQNVVRYGVAYPLRKIHGFTRPVAGKTGTTDEYKDAWFIGFTPDIVAGVWVGYDRPRSMGRLAAHTALPTWARIVGKMLRGFPPTPFSTDTQLEWRDVDPWTGLLADGACPRERMPFLPGTAPSHYCQPGTQLGPEFEDLDSLYGADSLEAPAPDTTGVAEPDSMEGGGTPAGP